MELSEQNTSQNFTPAFQKSSEGSKSKHKLRITILIIMIVFFGLGGVAGVWWWQEQSKNAKVAELQKQIDDLKKSSSKNSANPLYGLQKSPSTETDSSTEKITELSFNDLIAKELNPGKYLVKGYVREKGGYGGEVPMPNITVTEDNTSELKETPNKKFNRIYFGIEGTEEFKINRKYEFTFALLMQKPAGDSLYTGTTALIKFQLTD